MINEHLELSVTEADTERTHQIQKPRDAGQKSRPIIVKFVRYNDRKNTFNRTNTKRKAYCNYGEFNSHLNEKVERVKCEIYDFKNFWISDGKVFFKDGSGNTSLFYD